MSSLKNRRNRNPVYLRGFEEGFKQGKESMVDCITDTLLELKDTPGIGEKTWGKIESSIKEMGDRLHENTN